MAAFRPFEPPPHPRPCVPFVVPSRPAHFQSSCVCAVVHAHTFHRFAARSCRWNNRPDWHPTAAYKKTIMVFFFFLFFASHPSSLSKEPSPPSSLHLHSIARARTIFSCIRVVYAWRFPSPPPHLRQTALYLLPHTIRATQSIPLHAMSLFFKNKCVLPVREIRLIYDIYIYICTTYI